MIGQENVQRIDVAVNQADRTTMVVADLVRVVQPVRGLLRQ